MSGPQLFYEFSEREIASLLSTMSSRNARVLLLDKKYGPRCVDKEKWYGTKYAVETRPEKTRLLWEAQDSLDLEQATERMQQEGLRFPGPSPYIVTDFQLYSSASSSPLPGAADSPPTRVYPQLLTFGEENIEGREGGKVPERDGTERRLLHPHPCSLKDTCRIFFKHDTTFRVPKTIVELLFYFKSSIQFSKREAFLTALYASSLHLILTEVRRLDWWREDTRLRTHSREESR